MSESEISWTIEFIGVPMCNNWLICYGQVLELDDEPQLQIRIKLNQPVERIINQFNAEFISKLIQLTSPGIEWLPPELRVKILLFLPVQYFLNMARVNRHWNTLCNGDDLIWRFLCERDFGREQIKPENETWQQFYRRLYEVRKQRERQAYWNRMGLPPPLQFPALPPPPNYFLALPPPHPIIPLPYFDNLDDEDDANLNPDIRNALPRLGPNPGNPGNRDLGRGGRGSFGGGGLI